MRQDKLKHNDEKKIYGSKFHKDDYRMVALTDYLITEHEADSTLVLNKNQAI